MKKAVEKIHGFSCLTAFHRCDIMQSSKGGAGGKPCLTPTCRLVSYTYKKNAPLFLVGMSFRPQTKGAIL